MAKSKVQNRERLLRRLAAIQGAPRAAIRIALDESAKEITNQQRAYVPVGATGALKRSIGYTFGNYKAANSNVRGFGGDRKGDPELTVTIHAGDKVAWYAALVEFGTKAHILGGWAAGLMHPGSTPKPFFYTAYRVLRKKVRRRISKRTSDSIKKAAARP